MTSTPAAEPRSCAPAVLDVEVIGLERARDDLSTADIEELCTLALASAGVQEGHLAIEFVDAARIHELNREHRGKDEPTDVLSFPVDGADARYEGPPAPRELGDILICPEHTTDEREAVLHGALHLAGMDHETDDGEMLALQREILGWRRR
jgi:probable rRNA maturation factor